MQQGDLCGAIHWVRCQWRQYRWPRCKKLHRLSHQMEQMQTLLLFFPLLLAHCAQCSLCTDHIVRRSLYSQSTFHMHTVHSLHRSHYNACILTDHKALHCSHAEMHGSDNSQSTVHTTNSQLFDMQNAYQVYFLLNREKKMHNTYQRHYFKGMCFGWIDQLPPMLQRERHCLSTELYFQLLLEHFMLMFCCK